MSKKEELIIGKFQGGTTFGFIIPEDRAYYGGDFFVSKKNFGLAKDGDKVEAIEVKSRGKKPEAKIIKVFGREKNNKPEFIEGVFSKGDGNFGFIDVIGKEKGYFVYGKNNNGAKDGDSVKAELVNFDGKKEAKIIKILKENNDLITGNYKDNGEFGFVLTKEHGDIFIGFTRKNGAQNGDNVEVKIIRTGGKNPEGIITKIL